MEIISWLVTDDRIIRNVSEVITHFKFDPKIAKLIKLSYVACLNSIKKAENPEYYRFSCAIYGNPPAAFIIIDLWQNKYIYFDETLCMICEGKRNPSLAFFITEESYINIYSNIFNLFEQLDKIVNNVLDD